MSTHEGRAMTDRDWGLVWIKAVHFTACLSGVAWGRFQVPDWLNGPPLRPSACRA